MLRLRLRCVLLALCSLVLFFCIPVGADDTAVSVAAGGIQLRKEARISMEKERLFISESKVIVDFDFLNETDKDIATDVGFPVPPYKWGDWEPGVRKDFSDFRVWVNGQQIKYDADVRATLDGKDYTDLLRRLRLHIDVAPENYDGDWPAAENAVNKLATPDRRMLLQSGLIAPFPNGAAGYDFRWTIRKFYYWNQSFPVHRLLHIRHEYTPQGGFTQITGTKALEETLADACAGPSVRKILTAQFDKFEATPNPGFTNYFGATWVNYILTTANTWKTPIKDFQAEIETPEPDARESYTTSFCWNGPVQRIGQRKFLLPMTNFVPKQELAVYFFAVRM